MHTELALCTRGALSAKTFHGPYKSTDLSDERKTRRQRLAYQQCARTRAAAITVPLAFRLVANLCSDLPWCNQDLVMQIHVFSILHWLGLILIALTCVFISRCIWLSRAASDSKLHPKLSGTSARTLIVLGSGALSGAFVMQASAQQMNMHALQKPHINTIEVKYRRMETCSAAVGASEACIVGGHTINQNPLPLSYWFATTCTP